MEDEGRQTVSSDFGNLLRRHRLAAGLSQESLAERARMSSDGISALERGYRRTPQRETLALLVGALTLDDEEQKAFEAAASRPSVPRRGSVTFGPWPDAAATHVSLSLTSFVGRERELDEIAALMRERRLVTITGAGGVGKTQTALRVANASSDDADRIARFVALAPISDPSHVVSAIALALGLQEVPNSPLLETVVAYLKSKALLMVLDNCERVITEAATVAGELLLKCPQVRILATSREPLKAAGEYAYRLPSLSAASSAELFMDRARAVDHRFVLTDESSPIVAEICRRLDGIPLAIELAAARVNIFPVQEISKRLDHRFAILTGGNRTALPRQQTMRGAIDWSYDLLEERERRMFERLSVFAGGCTMTTASAVCAGDDVGGDDVIDLLSSLVDKSLLVTDFDGVETRYVLLESFREYAREKLVARSEHETIALRHARAYLALAERLRPPAPPERQAEAYAELENWRATLGWALSGQSDVVLGQRLASSLLGVWKRHAIVEGRRWIHAALELLDDQTPLATIADLKFAEADIAFELNEIDVALCMAEEALTAYQELDDSVGIARAQSRVGQALMFLGRTTEAETVLRRANEAATAAGYRMLAAGTLQTIAFCRSRDGDIAAARSHFEAALTIYTELEAHNAVAGIALNRAEAEFEAGDVKVALNLASDALDAFRRQGDSYSATTVLGNMAAYCVALARYDEACTHAREALNLARSLRLDTHLAWAMQHLAAVAALRPYADVNQAFGERTRAALLLGFVSTRFTTLKALHSRTEQAEYDRVLAILREAMGAKTVAELMADGAAIAEDQAIEEALAVSLAVSTEGYC